MAGGLLAVRVLHVQAAPPGRDGVLVGGLLEAGTFRVGAAVRVTAPGRPPVPAVIRGLATSSRPPRVGFLLGGVEVGDVPVGATITDA